MTVLNPEGRPIHDSWVKVGGLALEILKGEHDDALNDITEAAKVRLRMKFQKGDKFLVNRSHPSIDGQVATILKVNPKRIEVMVENGMGGTWMVSPQSLVPLPKADVIPIKAAQG